MKQRRILFICLAILIGLSLTFSQVLAAAPGSTAVKKTPAPVNPVVEQPGKGPDQKDVKQTENAERKDAHATAKAEKTPGPDKTKTPHPSDKVKGKHINFHGEIDAISPASLDVKLKNGDVKSVDMDENTRVHIPTLGGSSAMAGLQVGMEVSVHAIVPEKGGNPLVISINAIPGAPERVHGLGSVAAYEEGVSITITGKDGSTSTFDISGATILPKADIEVNIGDRVTVVSSRDVTGGALVAKAIVVHSPKTK